MKSSNPLELLLYSLTLEQTNAQPIEYEYERGMFISINNHKLISADLYQGFKKQYQSIMYGLTRSNISRDTIKVSYGRLLQRGSNIKGASYKVNRIKPVGRGKYLFDDPVTPATLYKYLTSPPPSQAEVCCINYVKYNVNNPNNQYPLTYLYQEF
jgi:hypothetical protein